MVTIQIATWNSADVLGSTLEALKQIPPTKAVIRFIDNHSTDNTRRMIAAALPHADIVELPHNIGFAGAHNMGFNKCTTPFVLTCDPDVSLSWDGLVELLDSFTEDEVGAVQGKLLREVKDPSGQVIIDSTGIIPTASLNGVDRGAGEIDLGQYNAAGEIAATTGACSLFRFSALEKVAYKDNEIFDNDFFAYKEDVDLGWRLRKAGFICRYEPVIIGVHRRTLGPGSRNNWGTTPFSFYKRLRNVRTHYSLRNYIWMLVKNISGREILIHEIPITIRLIVFMGFTILYPPLLMAWLQALQGLPTMVHKRVA